MKSELQGTRKSWGDSGELGMRWCRNSWAHIYDLILNNISKVLRTDLLASQSICMGCAQVQIGHWLAHTGQILISVPESKESQSTEGRSELKA